MKTAAKRGMAVASVCALSIGMAGCGGSDSSEPGANGENMLFVNVVKLTGVTWFDRMEVGLETFSKENDITVEQVGPSQATPEEQVRMVQDLIARKPTVLGVVPNSASALEGVLKRAMDEGIVVVSQEAPSLENTDVDIEAFDNDDYGAMMMDNLAECMGGSGEYASLIGSFTEESQAQWADAAWKQAQSKFPGIERVQDPLESNNDSEKAYQNTKELLTKYPNLKGILGSSAQDIPGAARAVEERDLEDQICVMGTSIPSVSGQYLKSGAVDKMFGWDPAVAGQAAMKLGLLLAEGKEITPGLDLGLEGYESIQPIEGSPHGYRGDAAISIDESNVADYQF